MGAILQQAPISVELQCRCTTAKTVLVCSSLPNSTKPTFAAVQANHMVNRSCLLDRCAAHARAHHCSHSADMCTTQVPVCLIANGWAGLAAATATANV